MGERTYTVRGLHGTGITRKKERGHTRREDTRGGEDILGGGGYTPNGNYTENGERTRTERGHTQSGDKNGGYIHGGNIHGKEIIWNGNNTEKEEGNMARDSLRGQSSVLSSHLQN